MTLDLDHLFSQRGSVPVPREPAPGCPGEETMAAWLDGVLPPSLRGSLEGHVLTCPDCATVLQVAVDQGRPPVPLRILARLADKGIELLAGLERLLAPSAGQPALGALRRSTTPPTRRIALRGPGCGLDDLSLQAQADGRVRLVVGSQSPLALLAGERASILFEVDGSPREKRPFTGRPVTFEPLGPGHYTVRILARAPGSSSRVLAEAEIELTG